jgi:hypothetical protein
VIKDKYPKAMHHYLVMPAKIVRGFSVLTREDVPLLKEMKKAADNIVSE